MNAPVRIVENTGERVVPSEERCEQTEDSAGRDDGRVGGAGRVTRKIADAEQQKGHVEREEQQEEGNRRSQGRKKHKESEYEPSHQEQAERVEELGAFSASQLLDDLESAGSENDAKGNPEASVGRERGSTERIADGHLPGFWSVQQSKREAASGKSTYHMPASN